METNDPARTVHLWAEAIANFTPEMWQHCIQHCENLIEYDWYKAIGNFNVEGHPRSRWPHPYPPRSFRTWVPTYSRAVADLTPIFMAQAPSSPKGRSCHLCRATWTTASSHCPSTRPSAGEGPNGIGTTTRNSK